MLSALLIGLSVALFALSVGLYSLAHAIEIIEERSKNVSQ